MGLFKAKVKPHKVIKFLNEADDALMRAYYTKDISVVAEYMTRDLLDYMSEELSTHDDLTAKFGLAKYRIRNWTILDEQGDVIVVHKEVSHKDVRIKGMISIPVGDRISEEWYVHSDRNSYLIFDIKQSRGDFGYV